MRKKTTDKKPQKRKKCSGKNESNRKWSARVTKTSDALDLEQRVFKSKSARKIAASLKRSGEKSKRKKGTPFQSTMSMLNFYINRAGKNLTEEEKKPLKNAKDELRKIFHKRKKIAGK